MEGLFYEWIFSLGTSSLFTSYWTIFTPAYIFRTLSTVTLMNIFYYRQKLKLSLQT